MRPVESSPKFPGYALISPVRNEASTILCTLASVLAQSVRPVRHVIVDDGSSDGTSEILEQAAGAHDFVRVIRLKDRGRREVGPGVVRAFEQGLSAIQEVDWEFVGKLDGDVQVPCCYYEKLLSAFGIDPRLGIASGACLVPQGGSYRLEPNVPFHTRGPCKMYRRACLDEMGGLVPTLGWDGLDGFYARMLGWRTRTLPELKVLHLRPTHGEESRLGGGLKAGLGAYQQHYLPSYLLARAVLNLFRPPYVLRSLGMVIGFLQAHIKGETRMVQPELVRFIHQEQRQRIRRVFRLGSKP